MTESAHQSLGLISLLVRKYDEALEFFVGKLGFLWVEETDLSLQDKRQVFVKPKGTGSACLLLARASTEEQAARIGDQTGGRVFQHPRACAFPSKGGTDLLSCGLKTCAVAASQHRPAAAHSRVCRSCRL